MLKHNVSIAQTTAQYVVARSNAERCHRGIAGRLAVIAEL